MRSILEKSKFEPSLRYSIVSYTITYINTDASEFNNNNYNLTSTCSGDNNYYSIYPREGELKWKMETSAWACAISHERRVERISESSTFSHHRNFTANNVASTPVDLRVKITVVAPSPKYIVIHVV